MHCVKDYISFHEVLTMSGTIRTVPHSVPQSDIPLAKGHNELHNYL